MPDTHGPLELPHAMHRVLAQLLRDYGARIYGTAWPSAQAWQELMRDLQALGRDRGWDAGVGAGAQEVSDALEVNALWNLLRSAKLHAPYTGDRPVARCQPPPGTRSLLVHTDPAAARRWLAAQLDVPVVQVGTIEVQIDWDSAVITSHGVLVGSAEPVPAARLRRPWEKGVNRETAEGHPSA